MTRKLKFTLPLALILAAGFALVAAARPQSGPEQLAQTSAEAWLALTDAGKYPESWQQAAALFKAAVTQEQWVNALNNVRTPLGKVISRKLKSATYTTSLPGGPSGEYVVIQFNTSFANRKDAVETITPTLDKDGQWRVSGYYIK